MADFEGNGPLPNALATQAFQASLLLLRRFFHLPRSKTGRIKERSDSSCEQLPLPAIADFPWSTRIQGIMTPACRNSAPVQHHTPVARSLDSVARDGVDHPPVERKRSKNDDMGMRIFRLSRIHNGSEFSAECAYELMDYCVRMHRPVRAAALTSPQGSADFQTILGEVCRYASASSVSKVAGSRARSPL